MSTVRACRFSMEVGTVEASRQSVRAITQLRVIVLSCFGVYMTQNSRESFTFHRVTPSLQCLDRLKNNLQTNAKWVISSIKI